MKQPYSEPQLIVLPQADLERLIDIFEEIQHNTAVMADALDLLVNGDEGHTSLGDLLAAIANGVRR